MDLEVLAVVVTVRAGKRREGVPPMGEISILLDKPTFRPE